MKICNTILILCSQATIWKTAFVMSEESMEQECPNGQVNSEGECQMLRNVNVKYHEANIIPTDRLESISPFKLDMLDSINLPAASQSVDLFTRSANVGVSFKGYLNFLLMILLHSYVSRAMAKPTSLLDLTKHL